MGRQGRDPGEPERGSLRPMAALWGREPREVDSMVLPHTQEARELYFYSEIKGFFVVNLSDCGCVHECRRLWRSEASGHLRLEA